MERPNGNLAEQNTRPTLHNTKGSFAHTDTHTHKRNKNNKHQQRGIIYFCPNKPNWLKIFHSCARWPVGWHRNTHREQAQVIDIKTAFSRGITNGWISIHFIDMIHASNMLRTYFIFWMRCVHTASAKNLASHSHNVSNAKAAISDCRISK